MFSIQLIYSIWPAEQPKQYQGKLHSFLIKLQNLLELTANMKLFPLLLSEISGNKSVQFVFIHKHKSDPKSTIVCISRVTSVQLLRKTHWENRMCSGKCLLFYTFFLKLIFETIKIPLNVTLLEATYMIEKVSIETKKNKANIFSLEDNVYSSYLVIESYICTFFLFPAEISPLFRLRID